MTAFILKSGICMVLFFGLYWLLLRKEKLFAFNRYYLILSVLFSLAVPFISFSVNLGYNKTTTDILTILNNQPVLNTVQNDGALANQDNELPGNSDSITVAQFSPVETRTMDIRRIFLIIYLSGFVVMLIRFLRNMLLINQMFRRSEKIDHQWYKIALPEHHVSPFSFLKTVFINKQDYINNRIGPNVFMHELEHVKQSHSLDVIFFEILQIVFWFNPVLLLYKRAVRMNHEYLADNAVIKSTSDIKTYANELINFISRGRVPVTSGFSPSMVRLRLLMLNTNTSRRNKNIRILITLFTSVFLMSILSFRAADPYTQDHKTKKGYKDLNKDIVIDEVNFRGPDFRQLKALIVMNGRKLGIDEVITVDPKQIKTLDILKNRKAIRKYGRSAKNGVVEITTYEGSKEAAPDSLKFKPMFTVNNQVPEGTITIPVSNLFSFKIWTYPIFPNQDLVKRWRTIEIMTRDYYKIKGTIVQKNGDPIPGVLLTATDNPYQVRTDKNGHFLLVDVKPDVVASLSADGFEPFYFKVNGVVFKSDLKITLDKKGESGQSSISINYLTKDFSGNWKYNKELSKPPFPGSRYLSIHQYDSDSLIMNVTMSNENSKEFKGKRRYVFNAVEKDPLSDIFQNANYTHSCSISPDGESFSATTEGKSKLGLFKDYKNTETYSLSDDGKQMFIRRYVIQGDSTNNRNDIVEIYDKN